MTTSEPASPGGWENPALPLTWSAADSPANPYPRPVAAGRRQTSAGYGRRRGPSFATYDRATRCWRTSQASLFGGWATYSATWPRAGMTRSGTAYPLPPSAPLTDGTGCSSLPTPLAARGGWNNRGELNLAGMAQHDTWPTPTSSLGSKGGRITPRKGREGGTLIEAVSARMWPTPAARDWKDRGDFAIRERSEGPSLPMAAGGPLNPQWVEWLMGFPDGWTDCGPSGTRSSRRSPNTSAAS